MGSLDINISWKATLKLTMAIEINSFVLISWMLRLKNVENNCKWVQNHTLRPPPTINNYYIILYSFLLLFYNVNKRKISTLFFPHWTNRGLNVVAFYLSLSLTTSTPYTQLIGRVAAVTMSRLYCTYVLDLQKLCPKTLTMWL